MEHSKFKIQQSLTSSHDSTSWFFADCVGGGSSNSIGFCSAWRSTTVYWYWSNDARDGHVSTCACAKKYKIKSNLFIKSIQTDSFKSLIYRFFFGAQMMRDIEWTFFQSHVWIIASTFDQMRLESWLQNYVRFIVRTHNRLIVAGKIHHQISIGQQMNSINLFWNDSIAALMFNHNGKSPFFVGTVRRGWHFCNGYWNKSTDINNAIVTQLKWFHTNIMWIWLHVVSYRILTQTNAKLHKEKRSLSLTLTSTKIKHEAIQRSVVICQIQWKLNEQRNDSSWCAFTVECQEKK